MALNEEEKQRLQQRVSKFEAATRVELVTSLTARCDNYPEIPWRAFAVGVALAASVIGLGHLAGYNPWPATLSVLSIVLGGGLLCTALPLFSSPVARLLLDAERIEAESQQAAESLFLRHELFNTPSRTGILMLVAEFEHRVVLLPDRGLHERLASDDLDKVIADMTPHLVKGLPLAAFEAGISTLEEILRAQENDPGIAAGNGGNVLPDHIDGNDAS